MKGNEDKFSTPSKDCITDDTKESGHAKQPTKRERDKPDVSHLPYVLRTWKAEIRTASGKIRHFAHKADELIEFEAIIKNNLKEGERVVGIIGGG